MQHLEHRRAWLIGLLLLLAAGLLGGCAETRHRRILERIDAHLERAMGNSIGAPANGKPFAHLDDANARLEVLRAIRTALFNEFWYVNRVSPEKMRAVAERLDANGGKDLETVQGCLRIMDLLEGACPTARQYVWFADIHDAQAEGNFPKLQR
jgi:hypothetical protein